MRVFQFGRVEQYDPNGMEAKHLEKELGIRVARHKEKKPSGSGAELAPSFLNNDSHSKKESSNSRGETNSPCEKFVFVGDRYLTDVVFGNKSGMFTIRVAPFDVSNESKAIAARSIESYFTQMENEKQNETNPARARRKNERPRKRLLKKPTARAPERE